MEKRNGKRSRKRLPIRYGEDGQSKVGFTDDISPSGLFIKSALVFPPGTLLQIQLCPSESDLPIQFEGRVTWARRVPPNLLRLTKGGMGVRITRFHAGEEDYRQLCDLLANR